METKVNFYEEIANAIIAQLEKGEVAWQKPWIGNKGFISHVNGRPYSALNCMMLMFMGGTSGEYLTFNQVKKEGGSIKKGAHAKYIYFFQMVEVTEKDETDGSEKVKSVFPVLKRYAVFHISDCENIKPNFADLPKVELDPITEVENAVCEYENREQGLTINRSGITGDAYYRPSTDTIVVPCINQYYDAAEYYSTLFHEMVHSTGIKSRLDRGIDYKVASFGSSDYGREELVAEMGAAMLINRLGLVAENAFKNSVAYIQNWIKAIKADPKMVVWAAGRAEKAAKYILNEIDE